MSSSQVPAFPLNAISYVTDRSVTNAGDVLSMFFLSTLKIVVKPDASFQGHIQPFLLGSIKEVANGTAKVYRHNPQDQVNASDDVKVQRFSISELEVNIAYNTTSKVAVVQAFMGLPIIGPQLVAAGAGLLRDNGVTVNMGPFPFLEGKLQAKLDDDGASLFYDFTAMGKKQSGVLKVF